MGRIRRSLLSNKAPHSPVPSIPPNQTPPEVQTPLEQPQPAESDFDPVPIPGENLSATVLRERR
jgi:hypothetical protein